MSRCRGHAHRLRQIGAERCRFRRIAAGFLRGIKGPMHLAPQRLARGVIGLGPQGVQHIQWQCRHLRAAWRHRQGLIEIAGGALLPLVAYERPRRRIVIFLQRLPRHHPQGHGPLP